MWKNLVELTDNLDVKCEKIKIILHISIEKNTRCGIISIQLADTESAVNGMRY